jgi:thiamine-monophosphate kinase
MTIPHGENEVLKKIERLAGSRIRGLLRLALGDDAALFDSKVGSETILTCDWFLEGTHFLRKKHPPDAVGWKCLARAASDVAAMGGTPRCFLLSLALPREATGKWLSGFLRGLRRASRALGCELAGGDTTRRNEILISVTVVGEIRTGMAIRRSGARPDDLLYVTGTLGEADLGLRMLRKGRGVARPTNSALRKHLYPEPRIAIGQWLAEKQLASAMMDLSDGLSTDLPRLCEASGVGAEIWAEQLPLTPLTERQDALALALHGGDDYELLFAVRPQQAKKIPKEYRGVSLTCVGKIATGKRILLVNGERKTVLAHAGWDPFRNVSS